MPVAKTMYIPFFIDNAYSKRLALTATQGGKGVAGSSGAPIAPTTTTSANAPSWTCTKADSGEDCCRRGGSDLHYCGGEFPSQRCFNSKLQWCCTDGTVCDEKNCCQDLFVSIIPLVAIVTTLFLTCLLDPRDN